MISLVLSHRQHGEKRYFLSSKYLERLPEGLNEEQQARQLARLMRLAPALEAGWEFEIQGEEVAA